MVCVCVCAGNCELTARALTSEKGRTDGGGYLIVDHTSAKSE